MGNSMVNQSYVALTDIIPGASTTGLTSFDGLTERNLMDKLEILQGADPTNPRSFVWEFLRYSDYLVHATEAFEGQVLIDLGCGRSVDGYIFAKIAGAKAYIGNDHIHLPSLYEKLNSEDRQGDKELTGFIEGMKKFLQKDRQTFVYNPKILSGIIDRMDKHLAGNFDIPYTLVPEDMKDFLKRIPDNSVSVFASGIDMDIISQDMYAYEIESEITRVVSPSGAFISYKSRLDPKGLVKDLKYSQEHTFEKYVKK